MFGGVCVCVGGGRGLSAQVSCINLHPLGDPPPASGGLAAVGLWDRTVRLLRLPSLAEAAREDLGGDVIPRSLLLATLEGRDYLLCAMGDGHLFSFRLDAAAAALSARKKVGGREVCVCVWGTLRARGAPARGARVSLGAQSPGEF